MQDLRDGDRFDAIVIGGEPGRPGRGLLPAAARARVRDPRCRRARRRRVAVALGQPAPVHAGQVRQPAGDAVPRRPAHVPDEGRRGRLPRRLRAPVRPARPHGRQGRSRPGDAGRVGVRGHGGRPRARGRAGRSSRRARTTTRSCRRSPATSIPGSCSSTPASTAGRRSFETARCWSSARPTRAPRSRSTSRVRVAATCGWPGATPGTCRSTPRAASADGSIR